MPDIEKEKSKPSDEELNKWLFENIMNGVDTEDEVSIALYVVPDYCNSLDLISRVEAKVMEEVGMICYAAKVWLPMRDDILREQFKIEGTSEQAFYKHGRFLVATARQRAEACKSAWEYKTESQK